MINIEHCTCEEFGTGFKVTADEGFALCRKDRIQAWEDYCELSEENADEYPAKTLFEMVNFSRVVYFPAGADGSNYEAMQIEDGMKVH